MSNHIEERVKQVIACHDVLDGRVPRPDGMSKEDVDAAFDNAVQMTHAVLRAEGTIV